MNSFAHSAPLAKMLITNSPVKIPAWKRAIDLACCLVALPFLCLITVLMAIALRLVSPGPILFRQERVGYKGSRFMCYKFRTSLVGPRPCLSYEYERYQSWQRERSDAVPGLTGLWQVSGKNRTTFDEMINLDIRYARTSTFWVDLRIILMTAPALLIQLADTRRARIAQVQPAGMTPSFSPETAVKSPTPTAVF